MNEKNKFESTLRKGDIQKSLEILEVNNNVENQLEKKHKHNEYANFILKNSFGAILCLKRTVNSEDEYSGLWCLPGGHIDISEQPKDAAIRELLEETNLDLKYQQANIELFDIVEVEDKNLFYYKYQLIDEENNLLDSLVILKNNEHSNYKWFTLFDIERTINFIGNLRETLLKAIK